MNFVVAMDKFKGTMDAATACETVSQAILSILPDAQVTQLPMADGGEGMVSFYRRVCDVQLRHAQVSGPYGQPVTVEYLVLPDGTAIAEMSSCAGLLLAGGANDPLTASTYGVGELILHIASRGIKKLILGLGGSATNDCGIGMAAALGYRFVNELNCIVPCQAGRMEQVRAILPPEDMPDIAVTAACDVDNPLCGRRGATYVFGPQKGVTPEMAAPLDAAVAHMAQLIERDLNVSVAELAGAGAAGGMGAAVAAFLGGRLISGAELMLGAVNAEDTVAAADVVFTGEGRLDATSLYGKAPVAIAKLAAAAGKPCIALCGAQELDTADMRERGITAAFSTIRRPGTLADIAPTAAEDLFHLTRNVVNTLICV